MKKFIVIFALFLISFISSPSVKAENNPFLSNKGKISSQASETSYYPEVLNKFFFKLNKTQRDLNKEMSRLSRDIKENRSPKSLFILILISFLYGAFHSIGPGHGKCFVCSYFLSEKNSIRKGILLGNLVAIIHALSALTIVSVIYFIFKSQNLVFFDSVSKSMSIFSYGLIICIGFSLLIKNTISILKQRNPVHIHGPECNHQNENNHDKNNLEKHIHSNECNNDYEVHYEKKHKKDQNIFWVAASIGLLPCPGAITILLFSISIGMVQLGILLAFFIALGMGITVSLTGIITILTRNGTLKMFSGQTKIARETIENTMKIIGSIMILFFGTFFLIGNL